MRQCTICTRTEFLISGISAYFVNSRSIGRIAVVQAFAMLLNKTLLGSRALHLMYTFVCNTWTNTTHRIHSRYEPYLAFELAARQANISINCHFYRYYIAMYGSELFRRFREMHWENVYFIGRFVCIMNRQSLWMFSSVLCCCAHRALSMPGRVDTRTVSLIAK